MFPGRLVVFSFSKTSLSKTNEKLINLLIIIELSQKYILKKTDFVKLIKFMVHHYCIVAHKVENPNQLEISILGASKP